MKKISFFNKISLSYKFSSYKKNYKNSNSKCSKTRKIIQLKMAFMEKNIAKEI